MVRKKEKLVVPLIIQGRNFADTGSIKEVILYILESAIKGSTQNEYQVQGERI